MRRREFLVSALAAGLLAGGVGWNQAAHAASPKLPSKLPKGRSIFTMEGDVKIDGKAATSHSIIQSQSHVETGDSSHVTFVTGDAAFTMRENSSLELRGNKLVHDMKLVAGAVLGVIGIRERKRGLQLRTPTVVIGIRGTGVYAETGADKTYFCTCYGHTSLDAGNDESKEIVSKHHTACEILAQPAKGKRIVTATLKNHTDLELMTLEALCGRKVPFEP